MHNLNGFNYFMVTALLSMAGFKFYKEICSGYEVWVNSHTGKNFLIMKISNNFSEEYLLGLLKQAGLTCEEFLSLA